VPQLYRKNRCGSHLFWLKKLKGSPVLLNLSERSVEAGISQAKKEVASKIFLPT
jgi:hypothetical protein